MMQDKGKSIKKQAENGEKKETDPKAASLMEVPKRYEDDHFVETSGPVWNYSLLTDEDVRNFQQGTHYRLYQKFGSHSIQVNEIWGMYFCVWAPNATSVSVVGNFNDWKKNQYELNPRWDNSGIWEGFIPHVKLGESYKYHIIGYAKRKIDKGDPFANFWEKRPLTASITWDMYYEWKDEDWMKKNGSTRTGLKKERSTMTSILHRVFMKCTLQAGNVPIKTTRRRIILTTRSAIDSFPMSKKWDSRMWNSCRSWSIRLTGAGVTSARAFLLPRPGLEIRRALCG
jgi:hypothetical protein